jgi:POT family proton-dependent oligopeptide transporter
MLLVPWLLKTYGASVAFSVPGMLMLLATVIFWSGRYRFVHIPAAGMSFVREALSGEGLRCLARLSGIYLFIAMFWALFDQNGSSWVLQAQQMDRHVFGIEILPSQIQAANPLLIVMLTPLFHKQLYPRLSHFVTLGYINKIAIGLFITVLSFVLVAGIQMRIDAGFHPNICWQMLAYLFLTSAEVMVSITCLEFSYTQAPKTMKSLVMSLYMAAVALGNLFTSAVNFFIENPDGSSRLAGASYFWFFAALMLVTALGFVWHSRHYKEQTYLQEET